MEGLLKRLAIRVPNLYLQKSIRESYRNIFGHIEATLHTRIACYGCILWSEVLHILNRLWAMVGLLRQCTFRRRWFPLSRLRLRCSGLAGAGILGVKSLVSRGFFLALYFQQSPVKEVAGVELGPGDLVRVGVHMDPVVLDLQVVACFVLHFKLDFEIAPVRLWLRWLILASAYPCVIPNSDF